MWSGDGVDRAEEVAGTVKGRKRILLVRREKRDG